MDRTEMLVLASGLSDMSQGAGPLRLAYCGPRVLPTPPLAGGSDRDDDDDDDDDTVAAVAVAVVPTAAVAATGAPAAA